MLHPLEEAMITCPYCGEPISLLVDCSVPEQHYIEDCEVCCRPIECSVTADGESYTFTAHTDSD